MKISNRWSIEGGRGDYVLVETREGTNQKTGLPTKSQVWTYHPTLARCAKKITHVMACESMESVTYERLDVISSEVLELLAAQEE